MAATARGYLVQCSTFLALRSVDAAENTLRQFTRWVVDNTDIQTVSEISRTNIEGDIVTNAHVVEAGTNITVTLPADKGSRPATLVASDLATDIAVLHLEDNSGLVPVPLGRSSGVVVGDDAIAIGNALALEGGPTVTKGIVSALRVLVPRGVDAR